MFVNWDFFTNTMNTANQYAKDYLPRQSGTINFGISAIIFCQRVRFPQGPFILESIFFTTDDVNIVWRPKNVSLHFSLVYFIFLILFDRYAIFVFFFLFFILFFYEGY